MIELLIEDAMPTQITEDKSGRVFLEGVMLKSNFLNKNGRYYPRDTMIAATEKIQSKIRAGQFFSSLGHENSSTVSPQNIAARGQWHCRRSSVSRRFRRGLGLTRPEHRARAMRRSC